MTKVSVIGNAGGGKSTICQAIAKAHHLPFYSVDKLQWQPGWVPTPAQEFNAQHQEIISSERWLLDGYGPWATVVERLDAADTIVLIDHPIWVHYWWATKRQIKSIFVGRADGPDGCPMLPVTFKLFAMMWELHKEMRPKLISEIQKHASTKRIIHIRSPRELNAFAQSLAN
ncbi:flagellar protein FlaR [Maritalea sp.]|uniref:flagellar protein FlaR n=1 Tax=Maritalea sp. TaxID=2003361 RepID=UPI003EF3A3E9